MKGSSTRFTVYHWRPYRSPDEQLIILVSLIVLAIWSATSSSFLTLINLLFNEKKIIQIAGKRMIKQRHLRASFSKNFAVLLLHLFRCTNRNPVILGSGIKRSASFKFGLEVYTSIFIQTSSRAFYFRP